MNLTYQTASPAVLELIANIKPGQRVRLSPSRAHMTFPGYYCPLGTNLSPEQQAEVFATCNGLTLKMYRDGGFTFSRESSGPDRLHS